MSFTAFTVLSKNRKTFFKLFFFFLEPKDFVLGLKLVEGLSDPTPQPHPRVFLDQSQGVEDWGPQKKKKNSEGQSTKKK